jgi:hypothetical protein
VKGNNKLNLGALRVIRAGGKGHRKRQETPETFEGKEKMKIKREAMELFTVIALLFALITFNIAAILISSDEIKKGSPAGIKGQTKESQVMNSRIWQGVTK